MRGRGGLGRIGLAALLGWSATMPANALALRVRVRARASLTVDLVRVGGEVAVRGRLLDVLGHGVGDGAVTLRLWQGERPVSSGAMTATATTSARGFYEARMTGLAVGEQVHVQAAFAGSPRIAATSVQRTIYPGKRSPRLSLEVEPALLTTDIGALEVAVFVGIAAQPLAGQALKLRIDGQPPRALRSGRDGWATVRLPTEELMPAGVHELVLEMPPTREDNRAIARTVVEVRRALVVSLARLDSMHGARCGEREICLGGKVVEVEPGGGTRAATRAAVTLHANHRRILELATDDRGRFSTRLDGDVMRGSFGDGDIGIVARARLAVPFSEPGWSGVVALRAPLPDPLSQWVYVGLLALMAAALAWRRVRDRLRERALARELEQIAAGLPARSVRRAGSGGVAVRLLRGTVIHGESGRPAAARVELHAPGGSVRRLDADDGTFRAAELEDGSWRLRVELEEHEPLEVRLDIPHDGTYDGCELLPRSHRAVVRGACAAAIRGAGGGGVNWRRETPAMAESRWLATARRGHAGIRAAVTAVERALYGSPTGTREVNDARAALEATREQR